MEKSVLSRGTTAPIALLRALGPWQLRGIVAGLVISGECFAWSYSGVSLGTLGFLLTVLAVAGISFIMDVAAGGRHHAQRPKHTRAIDLSLCESCGMLSLSVARRTGLGRFGVDLKDDSHTLTGGVHCTTLMRERDYLVNQ